MLGKVRNVLVGRKCQGEKRDRGRQEGGNVGRGGFWMGRSDGVIKGRLLDEVMVVTVFSGLEQW